MTDIKNATTKRAMIALIFSLAWPTMLEQLMQTAVQYVDLAMVGSLGTDAAAAVGSTTTVNWLLGSTISALGVGFLAIIAKAIGASDKSLVKRASAQTVFITLIAGTVFTVIPLALSPVVPERTRRYISSYCILRCFSVRQPLFSVLLCARQEILKHR